MPVIQDTVLSFLMWTSGGLLTALVSVLVYGAIGVLGKLNKIEADNLAQFKAITDSTRAEFQAFGRQLSAVDGLLREDMHRHDLRLQKLELEWQLALDKKHG